MVSKKLPEESYRVDGWEEPIVMKPPPDKRKFPIELLDALFRTKYRSLGDPTL